MVPEVKEKWVSALRSGEYKQGIGQLKNGDHFCCLGVLADIQGLIWGEILDREVLIYDDIRFSGSLPIPVRCEVGLPNAEHDYLTVINDSGSDFICIADYIEENL